MVKQKKFEIGFFESILKRNPRYTEVMEILGGLYTEAGRIDDGLRMDRRLVRLMPENPLAHYNLACSLALKEKPRDAIRSLAKAIDLGYTDVNWMLQDPDLDPIKEHPHFLGMINKIKRGN